MNDAPSTTLLLGLLALLVIIAFSSGTEVAMLSLNRYRIRHRAQSGHSTAKVLERLLLKPDDWLGAVAWDAADCSASRTRAMTAVAKPSIQLRRQARGLLFHSGSFWRALMV